MSEGGGYVRFYFALADFWSGAKWRSRSGTIWVNTRGGGLWRYSHKLWFFPHFGLDRFFAESNLGLYRGKVSRETDSGSNWEKLGRYGKPVKLSDKPLQTRQLQKQTKQLREVYSCGLGLQDVEFGSVTWLMCSGEVRSRRWRNRAGSRFRGSSIS